jgi:DNA polymerase-4
VIVANRGPCSDASKAVFEVFDNTSPVVEGLSIDEAFLDVRGMRRIAGAPLEIATRLRRDINQRVGLPITVGVARTKVLAKVASAVAKPDGLLVVPPHRELDFLHPLAVEQLWGVGPAPRAALLAVSSPSTSLARGGEWPSSAGRQVRCIARNDDVRRVRAGASRRSIASALAASRRGHRRDPHASTVTRRMRSRKPHRAHGRPPPPLADFSR